MNARRRQYRNPFSFRSLVVILLGGMLGTVWMVSRVAARNRLHQMTQEQRKLETEIHLLNTEIRMMTNRVQSLLTHDGALRSLEESGVDLEKEFPKVIPSRLFLLGAEPEEEADLPSDPETASEGSLPVNLAQAIPSKSP
jgi:hypothetical protein